MTRQEYDQLCTIFGEISLAVTKLGDAIIAASHEMMAEDEHHTSLENQQEVEDAKRQRPV